MKIIMLIIGLVIKNKTTKIIIVKMKIKILIIKIIILIITVISITANNNIIV